MAKLNHIKFYLAHETRDGRAVIGLSGWRDSFVRAFTTLGGGCTIASAHGAYSQANGLVQLEGVTVFECYYDDAHVPASTMAEFTELLARYGREAEQAAVMVVVNGDIQLLTKFGAVPPGYREQFLDAGDGHDGANA